MDDTAQAAGLIGLLQLYVRDRKPRDVHGTGFGQVLDVLLESTKPVALVGQPGSGRTTVLALLAAAGATIADEDDVDRIRARRGPSAPGSGLVAACSRPVAVELAAVGWEIRVLEAVALDERLAPVPVGDPSTRFRLPAWDASWAVALGAGPDGLYDRIAEHLGRSPVERDNVRTWAGGEQAPDTETGDNDALDARTPQPSIADGPPPLDVLATAAGIELWRTPVTVAQFAPFVATGYRERKWWHDSPRWSAPLEWERQRRHPQRPVHGVSSAEADAYARWLSTASGRPCRVQSLATALAAASFDGRAFPWGEEPPRPGLLNFAQHVGHGTDVDAHPAGAGVFGHLDLSGNVWEWCADEDDAGLRVVRSGGWFTSAAYVRSDYRFAFHPHNRFHDLGFRIEVD